MTNHKINLGDKCRDKVTGFTGICVSRTDHLHGCTRISITPQELHDGKPIDTHWFDEPQVELLEKAEYKIPKELVKTGGPSGRIPTSKPPKR